MEISKRIKELLESRNIQQKELANETGLTESTISYYVSGRRRPHSTNLSKIAKALGTTSDYLMGLSSDAVKYDRKIGGACIIQTNNRHAGIAEILLQLKQTGIQDIGICVIDERAVKDCLHDIILTLVFVGNCSKEQELRKIKSQVREMADIWEFETENVKEELE